MARDKAGRATGRTAGGDADAAERSAGGAAGAAVEKTAGGEAGRAEERSAGGEEGRVAERTAELTDLAEIVVVSCKVCRSAGRKRPGAWAERSVGFAQGKKSWR